MNEISLQSDCQNAMYIQYKYNVRSQGVPMIKLSDSSPIIGCDLSNICLRSHNMNNW